MQPASDTAAFYLPGLVHQFGNLLLTVQGHVMHVPADGMARMQDAVNQAVHRGGDSLRIVRALLGDRSSAPGEALGLVQGIVELGRVPAREHGLAIEWRGPAEASAAEPHGDQPIWVHGDAFVQVVAASLRQWLLAVPAGSGAVVTIACAPAASGGVLVTFGLDAGEGNLPFPVASEEIAAELRQTLATPLQDCAGEISGRGGKAGLELQVGPAAASPGPPGIGLPGVGPPGSGQLGT